MPDPKHAQPASPPEPAGRGGTAAAWLVLVAMGGTSVTFQVWHAVHSGAMPLALALLFAGAPVTAAMGLSHLIAVHRCGRLMKSVTVAVMLGAMGLSAGSIAAVIAPIAMHLSWLFGAVLDAAALVALAMILTERDWEAARRAVADATAKAAAEAAASAAREAMERAVQEPPAVPAEEPRPAARKAARTAARDPDAEKARAAYRKSVRDGAALSDRALGEMFGRSRTWGGNRIAECKTGPHLAEAAAR